MSFDLIIINFQPKSLSGQRGFSFMQQVYFFQPIGVTLSVDPSVFLSVVYFYCNGFIFSLGLYADNLYNRITCEVGEVGTSYPLDTFAHVVMRGGIAIGSVCLAVHEIVSTSRSQLPIYGLTVLGHISATIDPIYRISLHEIGSTLG